MDKGFKLSLMAMTLAAVLSGCADDGSDGAAGTPGQNGQNGQDGSNGENGQVGKLTRIATVPLGAEVTGIFLNEEGDLFFNLQHPSSANTETDHNDTAYNRGTVGVLTGVNFNQLPMDLVDSPVPASEKEQQTVMAAYGQYQIIGQNGDTLDGKLPKGLGVIHSLSGDTAVADTDMPDFNAYVAVEEGKGYLFTNWEHIPGGMSRLMISKSADGSWKIDDAMMLDFSEIKGTAANCFGSLTPWGTPLSSEEWIVGSSAGEVTNFDWNNPDAQYANDTAMQAMLDGSYPNPYDYGYIIEVTDPKGEAKPVKHYALGRYEHENGTVMPDQRTVYLSQDDTGGVMFKFVADAAGDLSAGTLYGAKLTQDAGSTEPLTTGFDVEWVELAHGNSDEIESWIREYDGIDRDDYVEGETSYMTNADVEAWANGDANYPSVADGGSAVTAGKPMDDRAAFLESRYAADLKGATSEFRKLEGININAKRAEQAIDGKVHFENETIDSAYVYFAIADLDKTMIDGEGDIALSSRVKDCGGVYRMPLGDNYNVNRIEPVVMGSTYRDSLTGAARCDVDQLSQPDNVIVMDDGRLLIGEDGFQTNNTLWMYNPINK
ncbi:alkaline phosphatase PhoX [Ferrimonas aestuarii]|uniref:DUF839 domain-containing protein n=1 Tax=Ferrimonas aestuarii TaxID=2569539 RepID=A0A4U1BLZ8_9GAMM|nr:alkaline phosphatase PhoX [Ferrimonas aestuarii]TKB51872.1 DUF839 domain-containing protein [Ferrimonas aestuarii]